jgi:LTXXQ motif family protein
MCFRPFFLAGSTAFVALAGFAWLTSAAALDSGFDDDGLMFAQVAPPAAPPPAAGGAERTMRGMPSLKAMCQEQVARRIGNRAYIKAKLDLKPEQMSAWTAFEKAADEASAKDKSRCASLPEDVKTPPTYPDRLNLQEEMMKARLESIQAVKPSLQALYASLTPEQKAVFDRPIGGPMRGPMRGRDRGPGPR